ncbi:hypothetical protein Scep_016303 [Stephania cephalantha]|uniref:Uncharacterized protein n=1 Tax=Stephania cephalantha TaxID=152367 RepID=A0AAP0NUI1_9MAGN
MEAFDCQPKVEAHLRPIITRSSDCSSRGEPVVKSTQESGCTFSSCTTAEDVQEVEEQKPILIKRYLKESIALHRLLIPHESQQKSIDEDGSKDFPCNNPFKRRKLEDVYLKQQQDISEQVSQVTEAEKPVELLSTTPGSQESVTSKPTKNIVVHKAVKKTVSKLKNNKSCSNSANSNSSILSFFKPL